MAYVEQNARNSFDSYRVVRADGIKIGYFGDYESAKRYADEVNEKDYSETHRNMPISRPKTKAEIRLEKEYAEQRLERARKRDEQKKRKIEENRKSKKADDKYVFVISCKKRDSIFTDTRYLQGETNIMKIDEYGGGFITSDFTEAKVFTTKAAAQKYIDKLNESWVVVTWIRDLKVVQKSKAYFKKGAEN